MNWPAPSLLPPPPDVSPPADPPSSVESEADRRRLSAIPAATWVALVGGALVLLAAAIVVVSNWDTIGRSFRFAGFAVVTAALIVVADRLRPTVPTTAGIIAHVGTFLTAAVGIAGASLFGVTWPGCLLIGGLIAAATTEVQAQRWERSTFRLGQIAGLCMASTGLAALTGTTGGLVAVAVAVGLLAVGAQRRAAGLAILAVLSPALTALTEAGIGAGTFERAGLIGGALSWSGPIVGVAAAMVLAIVASQRRNYGLMLMAALSPVLGLVTGLSAIDGSGAAWPAVPALVVIALELGWWMLPADRFREQITQVITAVGIGLSVVGWAAPQIVTSAPFDSALEHPWAIAVALTAVALAMLTMRLRATNPEAADVALAGLASTTLGVAVALAAPTVLVAVVAVAIVPLAAYLSRRMHPLAVYLPAAWAVLAIVEIDHAASPVHLAVSVGLLAVLTGTVAALRARLSYDSQWFGWFEMSAMTVVAVSATIDFAGDHTAAVMLAAAAVTIATVALIERRYLLWAITAMGVAGFVTADAAVTTVLDDRYWIGWAVVTLSLLAIWSAHRDRPAASAAAAAAVITAATASVLLDVTAEQFIGLAMLATIALTGVVLTLQRRSALDAAALAAGGVLLLTSAFDVDPAWVSAIWVVLGLQIVCAGAATGQRWLGASGLAVTAVATASWWFTSGLHDWFLDAIAPFGITVGDLWAAGLTVFTLIAGITVRRTLDVNSWFAYSGTLAISCLWLVSVQLERDTEWALPLALTIGMLAVGLGAWHRLAAPLVGGTIFTAITIFVAAGSDLAAIPGWAWLATGGLVLLGVAVLIERGGKQGVAGIEELVDRWN